MKLNPPVVVSLEKREFAILVEWPAFEFEARRIDMCTDNMETFLQPILADHQQRYCPISIDLIVFPAGNQTCGGRQFGETIFFGKGHRLGPRS